MYMIYNDYAILGIWTLLRHVTYKTYFMNTSFCSITKASTKFGVISKQKTYSKTNY